MASVLVIAGGKDTMSIKSNPAKQRVFQMSIHVLKNRSALLEASLKTHQVRLADLRQTREEMLAKDRELTHVLKCLRTYVGDSFPMSRGSEDVDWDVEQSDTVLVVFGEAQENQARLALVNADIRSTEAEIEKTLREISICKRADVESRTFQGH